MGRTKKYTAYDAVEHRVSKAAEIAQREWLDSLKPTKPKSMRVMRCQYLSLFERDGYILYQSANSGKWFLTNNSGFRGNFEVPEKIVHRWIREDIMFANGKGYALKAGRALFQDVEEAEYEEWLKARNLKAAKKNKR